MELLNIHLHKHRKELRKESAKHSCKKIKSRKSMKDGFERFEGLFSQGGKVYADEFNSFSDDESLYDEDMV